MDESSPRRITRALISVSDKTGLVEFAQTLQGLGIEIISTGGTSRLLREAGLSCRDVADVTGFPEMLDGRVKTLHPRIHGGILGIRSSDEHVNQMHDHEIEAIDLVVVNLYPFAQTVRRPGVSMTEAIENIDIGGPAMIRSASKNHNDVAVIVDPGDYGRIGALLESQGGALPLSVRYDLAQKAFRLTAEYDLEIARYLKAHVASPTPGAGAEMPEHLELSLEKAASLRYGENPHQRAALYRDTLTSEGGIGTAEQLQGKELSYNNLMDSDAAWELILDLRRAQQNDARARGVVGSPSLPHACAIIKHTNPCGVATAATALEAFEKARATDPVSAFGGIIAFSQPVDESAAAPLAEMFAEVIIAPGFTPEAIILLKARRNLRVLRVQPDDSAGRALLFRKISGGMLVQEEDRDVLEDERLEIVTDRKPLQSELRGLRFAWLIAKHVKSNAIVYASENQLVGVGAGQMSRVDSVKLGAMKAQLPLAGTVVASDAFFPFRDGIDEAARHGVTAAIQPGGSVRDKEVIEAANEHGMAMVFTGMRHFKH
jgi:phosphoribosylaminoimidazolecarboxamide formyltransferase / IMP cyclohydrolase